MTDLEDVISKRLKAIRENLKLNQSEFAERLGISQAAVSQFEDGKRVPSIETLEKIASRLSRSIQSLLSDENASDDEKEKLLQDLMAKLTAMNKESLLVMNRFVTDWTQASKNE
jgi:transcriptional regulator with XRE-family HTH domain